MNRKDKIMSRPFLITAGTWAFLGATIGWAAERGPDSAGLVLDLRSHEGQAARVESLPGRRRRDPGYLSARGLAQRALSGPQRPGVGLELPGIPPARAKESGPAMTSSWASGSTMIPRPMARSIAGPPR